MNDPKLSEQQLLAATSRQAPERSDPEVASLRQGYLALAELLQKQDDAVDQAGLVSDVLANCPQRVGQGRRSEAWMAMLALAASVLLMVSLAATQFGGQGSVARIQPEVSETNTPEDVDPQLAWDDHWDSRLEEARESAAAYRMARFTRWEATTWSASEALREIDEELSSIQ